MSDSQIPTCRWGIITVGLISSWFVADLVAPRPDAKAKHIIQAIGASSEDKGRAFVKKYITDVETNTTQNPTVYSSYEQVYNDPNVDCIYIGSPHGLHYRDLKNAISAGKNVLCEKAFTINAREAREVFALAKEKNVYVAEAMWLRHRPLIRDIRKQIYDDKVIGEVFRTTCDFRMGLDFSKLDKNSRHLIPELGAGSLLDIGIYPLTWAMLTLDPSTPAEGGLKAEKSEGQGDNGDLETTSEQPTILASQTFAPKVNVENSTAAIITYPSTGRQGIITSTMKTGRGKGHHFATIEGSQGFIEVEGNAPSHPTRFTVYPEWKGEGGKPASLGSYEYPLKPYQGFIYEADNAAIDIAAGRKESSVMPWGETVRVMEVMDEIRKQGGTVYPQDK